MTLYQVYDTMTGLANQERSEKMAAYMRHQFDFLGIPTPLRRQQEKATFKAAKQTKTVDWDFIDHCWQSSYREHQYLAIDYLVVMEPFLAAIDLAKIEQLVITKAWWDSVDALSEVVRKLVRRLPALKAEMLRWSLGEIFGCGEWQYSINCCKKNRWINHCLKRSSSIIWGVLNSLSTKPLVGAYEIMPRRILSGSKTFCFAIKQVWRL